MISQKYSKPFYEKDGELYELGVDDYIDPQDKTVRLLNLLDYKMNSARKPPVLTAGW